MTALLDARGVLKRFGGLTAVDGVDIDVGAGEVVGLIGPNGSGKTTLFDCLSRVSSLDSGSIRFDGVDISRHRPHQVARLGLARTFQLIRVYRELTVSENMELSIQWGRVGTARLFGRRTDPATRRRVESLLEFLLLARHRDERAGALSGGQRRLLEIGMALMSEPKLVLLDEATSGVNPTLVTEIADRLREVNANGVAILLVEHNVRFVAELCHRVVVLDRGAKLAEGTPRQVMENPAVIEAYFGAEGE